MKVTTTVAGVLLALLGTMLGAPAAYAGQTQTASTYNEQLDTGHALAQATVDFRSRRSFDIEGWVKDVCGDNPDGDGFGAYARVTWGLRGGATGQRGLGKDVNGCGNGKRRFDPAPKAFDRRLRYVSLHVCEKDADDPGAPVSCAFKEFHHPRDQ